MALSSCKTIIIYFESPVFIYGLCAQAILISHCLSPLRKSLLLGGQEAEKISIPYTSLKEMLCLMIMIRGVKGGGWRPLKGLDSQPSSDIICILTWLYGKCICTTTRSWVNNRFYESPGRALLGRRRFEVVFLTSVQYITFIVNTVKHSASSIR